MIRLMLKDVGVPVNAQDSGGWSALHATAEQVCNGGKGTGRVERRVGGGRVGGW